MKPNTVYAVNKLSTFHITSYSRDDVNMSDDAREERRKAKRRELLLLLPVYDAQTQQIIGSLGDISLYGLMLFSQTPIVSHQNLVLDIRVEDLQQAIPHSHIQLPEGFELQNLRLHLHVQSRWNAEVKNQLYKTGFMFTHVDDITCMIVRQVVRYLWAQRSIGSNFMTITLYLEDFFEVEEKLNEIEETIREMSGVVAVSFRSDNQRVVLVQYEPDETSCHTLMSHLIQKGIMVRLIGV